VARREPGPEGLGRHDQTLSAGGAALIRKRIWNRTEHPPSSTTPQTPARNFSFCDARADCEVCLHGVNLRRVELDPVGLLCCKRHGHGCWNTKLMSSRAQHHANVPNLVPRLRRSHPSCRQPSPGGRGSRLAFGPRGLVSFQMSAPAIPTNCDHKDDRPCIFPVPRFGCLNLPPQSSPSGLSSRLATGPLALAHGH
jgi:hypothetical protein